jgi:hypothetical protein
MDANENTGESGGPGEEMSLGDFWELHAEEIRRLVHTLRSKYPRLKQHDAEGIAKDSMYHKYEYGGRSGSYDVDLIATRRIEGYQMDERINFLRHQKKREIQTKPGACSWAAACEQVNHDLYGDNVHPSDDPGSDTDEIARPPHHGDASPRSDASPDDEPLDANTTIYVDLSNEQDAPPAPAAEPVRVDLTVSSETD